MPDTAVSTRALVKRYRDVTAVDSLNLTVRENLDIQRRLTGSQPASVADSITLLGLNPYTDRRAGQLSLGNKQRLSLARALLHSPELLVLDEPANGLDPAGIVEIRQLLRSLADERGVTVFMSSHILAEVAHLADRIGIVHGGRLIEEASREEFAAKARAFAADAYTPDEREQSLLKASLTGLEATWPEFFYMLTLVFGVGGMLLLAFIVAYLFGREYRDATAKNMLALPVPRHWFAVAKLAVAAVWWMALVVIVLIEAMGIGLAMGLPGFSAELAGTGIANVLLAAAISFLLAPVIAWIAVWSRGEVAPIAFSLVMLALGNLFGKTGWAEWFPYSIVPLLIGMVASPVESLPAGSYVVLAGTFVAGVAATVLQLRFADNAQ